jgi:hypothetical protein
MADVEIRLTLRDGQLDGDRRWYLPGSTVRGTATLMPSQDVRCDRVVAAVGWHTEGRGDKDKRRVAEVTIARGPLAASSHHTYEFSFLLPLDPWSYTGHHINVVWAVTVTVVIPFGRDIEQAEHIVVGPSRLG